MSADDSAAERIAFSNPNPDPNPDPNPNPNLNPNPNPNPNPTLTPTLTPALTPALTLTPTLPLTPTPHQVRQLHAAGRLRLFVDCHAHSNKRGCFLYGNALPDQLQLVEAVTYAKLIEQNCRWFDFEGCTFSQASMSAKDPRDGAVGKEGSGRVGVYRRTAAWSK